MSDDQCADGSARTDDQCADGSARTDDQCADGFARTDDQCADGFARTDDQCADGFAGTVVIDGYLCRDLHWLAGAVEGFARSGELEAIANLVRFANPHLSADGLAEVAGQLALALRQAARAAL